jgi:hypothetical protein
MIDATDHGGTYRWPINGQTFPRVQMATIEGLLAWAKANHLTQPPGSSWVYFFPGIPHAKPDRYTDSPQQRPRSGSEPRSH